MAVSIPKWFDWNAYLNNKLATMPSGTTMSSLVSAMDKAGFVGEEGSYRHFLQFGHGEDVSPSAGFDASQYYTFKAAQYYNKAVTAVTAAESATVAQLIKDAGMDAWTHSQKYGTSEMISTSNSFDTAAYLQEKAAAMGGTWTAATVATAIQNAGMSAYEHYMQYKGTGSNEVSASATYVVDSSKQASNPGQTFTLTTGVDVVKGTSGDDTIFGDNTGGAPKQLATADQIDGGAGTDTLKVYLAAGDKATGQPTLTNIEKVWINGGAITAYTAATGTTGLIVEAPVANTVATYTLAGQDLTLKSFATTAVTATTVAKAATGTQTAQNITLDGFVDTNATAVLNTINVTGADIATLNLVVTGANSETNLANTVGAAIKAISISGDKNLTAVESIAMATAVTKIDASAATGNISVDTSAGAKAAAFAFVGGAGNDKLTLAAGDLALLTSGAQLNGGAGTDTIVINDKTPAYDALNKAVGFEVLGLGVTATTVDAAQLTGIKSFAIGVATSTETINNLGAGSKVAITDATTAVNLGAAVGNTEAEVTLGTATTAGFVSTALNATGLTNLTLVSNGTSAHTITALGNSDNTLLTIKGAADLTITGPLAGTTTGNKVDASALTGKLSVVGSGKSDIIIGGSNDDILAGGAGATISDTLTGGAGKDKFVIIAGAASAAEADVVTDFVTKVDTLDMTGPVAGSATNFSKATATVADFAAALAAANAALDKSVLYNVQQIGSDSYVFADAAASGSATEVVKLVGVSLSGVAYTDIVA